jgi:hypothetical protein
MSHYLNFDLFACTFVTSEHSTMSAQRRSSAVGALTSAINPSIDSYIEKKRAMEERARQIKEERANRKPGTFCFFVARFTVSLGFLSVLLSLFSELDQAAQSRAAELNRFRRPAMPPVRSLSERLFLIFWLFNVWYAGARRLRQLQFWCSSIPSTTIAATTE